MTTEPSGEAHATAEQSGVARMTAEPVTEDHAAAGAAPDPEPASAGEGSEAGAAADDPPLTVEGLVDSLEGVTRERDGYLDSLARLQAEFENYRKAIAKRESDARERANENLVAELLPILDACDGAVASGAEDVVPVKNALVEALEKQGLVRLDPVDAPFDPEQHEAVMHDPSEEDDGPVVAEVLRVGYQWKGRTLRAAMVRVRG